MFSSVFNAGQIVFTASDLPHEVGDYYSAYANLADVDVAGRIGPTGGPHRWDFSQPKSSGETIQRTDLVLTTDGVEEGDGGKAAVFPEATYAERATRDSDGSRFWNYYRPDEAGRRFFGFFNPAARISAPVIEFKAPTIDLPARIEYGQKWSRTVEWEDLVDTGFLPIRMSVKFTNASSVDAYGTVVLPRIGEVEALRVNEVNTYHSKDMTLGVLDTVQVFRNYYWLARGIGKCVEIGAVPETKAPAENFARAKTFLRVFESSKPVPPPACRLVKGLSIQLDQGHVRLKWQSDAAAAGYRVEATTDLGQAGWQLAGEPLTNYWSEPMLRSNPQRFFRISPKP